jgi:CRP-like cAMP-binding protein
MAAPIASEQLHARFSQLFGSTPIAQIQPVADRLELRELPAGASLFQRGAPSGELVLVLDGALMASITEGGKRLELTQIGPGEWLGEVGFLDRGPATADVIATAPSRVLVLSADAFDALCDAHPRVARDLLHAICSRLSARVRRTARLLHEQGVSGSWRSAPLVEAAPPAGTWLDRIRQSLFRHA